MHVFIRAERSSVRSHSIADSQIFNEIIKKKSYEKKNKYYTFQRNNQKVNSKNHSNTHISTEKNNID